MAGLQRSVETFRRSGSSGLVWDDKFAAQLGEQMKNKSASTREFMTSSYSLMHEPNTVPIMSSCGSACRPVKVSPLAAARTTDDHPPPLPVSAWCGLFGSKRTASTKRTAAASSGSRKRP